MRAVFFFFFVLVSFFGRLLLLLLPLLLLLIKLVMSLVDKWRKHVAEACQGVLVRRKIFAHQAFFFALDLHYVVRAHVWEGLPVVWCGVVWYGMGLAHRCGYQATHEPGRGRAGQNVKWVIRSFILRAFRVRKYMTTCGTPAFGYYAGYFLAEC